VDADLQLHRDHGGRIEGRTASRAAVGAVRSDG
jgi:hypothetical protein